MNNNKWREISCVAISGLLGGLLAWFLGLSAIAPTERFTSFVSAILGGAIAAGVGVYLIANTDTSQVARLIFFAALCGLSWQAVLATGNNLVQKAVVRAAINSTNDASKTLTEQGGNSDDTAIKSVADKAVKVVDKLPSIESGELKSDARQTVSQAIKTLTEAAPVNPKATEAIADIAKRADETGSTKVKSEAVNQLQEIAKDQQKFPEVARKTAETALEQIRTTTTDM